MKKALRSAFWVVIGGILILSLLLAYFNFIWVPQVARLSFPQIEGRLQVQGLDGPVDIYRDRMGIPHIFASTTHDLFFAQGYVHAQDRFWQMDFWRHIGSGRLAEMFGAGQVRTDAFLRTLGWRQIAEEEYARLGPESRAILDAYAEGVNAYIAGREPRELSLEYAILLALINRNYTVEPWTPIHSLTWGKAMAWDLRGNMDAEIERAVLLKTLTAQQVEELFPPYPEDHPRIVPHIGVLGARSESEKVGLPQEYLDTLKAVPWGSLSEPVAALDTLLGAGGLSLGSNSWAVSGTRTATGKPLLANDPHLGIQMPSIWYQISLHCRPLSERCPLEVAGFSFAGVPGVIIGHNPHLAWGFTNVGPDVMDLYILKVNPENPDQYEFNGSWVDFETRQERILIAGGGEEEIRVRLSRFGPVISEVYGPLRDEIEPKSTATPFREQVGLSLPESYAIALRWTALEPSSPFEAIWGFNTARNWDEFRAAARHFAVPAQNLLYADVEGNIAYQMPGNIPIRKKGDGRLPVPGWTDEYDWLGYIPFEELPFVVNPPEGYIVTANNQVPPDDYPYLITSEWDYGFRAQRIVEMIENAPGSIDIAYMQKMQGDNKSLIAANLVPLLMAVDLPADLAALRDQFLASWDFQENMDSASAALFEAFYWELLETTFGDEAIPPQFQPKGGSRYNEILRRMIRYPESPWWDDKSTPDRLEQRDDILVKAFTEAVRCKICRQKFGSDVAKWQWGVLHASTFRNATLGRSGITLIENLFNRGPFPTAGGESIVNATGWTVGESFETDWLPSMRMIVDLGNLNNSVTVHTTGQSGHAFHPHYIDMADLWRLIQYYPMLWSQSDIVSQAEGHLQLTP